MPDSYNKIIAENNTYQTSKRNKSSLFGPTLSFYSKLARIILRSSNLAKAGKYNRYEWVNASLAILHALESVGVEVNVEGMENLKSFEGPAVIIGNHMSAMETMVPVSIIQPLKPVVYVIKRELADFPFFGNVVMARYPIVVSRSNPREDLKTVMEEGSRRLEENRSIILFPQRTRQVKLVREEFNSLGVKLAKRNNVPVIPFAVLTDAWSNGKKLKDFGPIDPRKKAYFALGKPITVESKGQEEHEMILDFISNKLTEWGRPDLVVKEGK